MGTHLLRVLSYPARHYQPLPVYNVTERWRRPQPNCRCVIVPIPVYRIERLRSPSEIAAGQAVYRRIEAGKDWAKSRLRAAT